MHVAVLLDFVGLGTILRGDEPERAVLIAAGDGHRTGTQFVLTGMRDEHGGRKIVEQGNHAFKLGFSTHTHDSRGM
jgi:hypothetical protein